MAMIERKKRTLVAAAGFRQKPRIILGHLVHIMYLRSGANKIRSFRSGSASQCGLYPLRMTASVGRLESSSTPRPWHARRWLPQTQFDKNVGLRRERS